MRGMIAPVSLLLLVLVAVTVQGGPFDPWPTPSKGSTIPALPGILRSSGGGPPDPMAANDWANMNPASPPPARYAHAMAYDNESDRVVVFGGWSGTRALSDTWVYDFNANVWTAMSPSASPTGRYGHAMAYDSQSDRIVLFGGYTGAFNAETWAYNLNANTWTNLNPATHPTARMYHAMAYDAESDRIVLFGGNGGSDTNDTWAFDYNSNTWAFVNPPTTPSPRSGHAMAYDSQSDRIVLFGGWTGIYDAQTWTYDTNANRWANRNPGTRPPGRSDAAAAYGVQADRVYLFGGRAAPTYSDTWAYDANGNAWTNMNPATRPPARWGAGMAYDTASDRVVLFGGQDGTTIDRDTWAYQGPATRPGAPRSLQAVRGDAWVNLSWQAPLSDGGSPITGYRVYRGTSPSGLALLTSPGAVLTCNDTGLTNGVTYYYQVTAINAVGEGPPSNQVSATPATVPGAPRSLQASAGDSRVDLAWREPGSDGGSPVTGYRIFRGTSPGSLSLLTQVGNVTVHSDTGVTNGVTYYYEVTAVNSIGEGPRSNRASAAAQADTTSPTVSIVSPGGGAVLSSLSVTVSGTASDNVGVQTVEISTDGANWTLATGTASWSGQLTLREGTNTIYARATDTSGNTATMNVTVSVDLHRGTVGVWALVVVAVALAVLGVAAVFLIARRSKGTRGS